MRCCYLIVFGSVLAYTAYTWLLQNANVSRVSTYAYVNPLVAIFLGSVLLHEPIDVFIVVGAAMIIVAVSVVVRTESSNAARSTPTGAAEASPAASRRLLAKARRLRANNPRQE